MPLSSIRVVLADDHPIIAEGVKALLSRQAHIHVVGTATNFQEVFTIIDTTPIDVVILDLTGMQGSPLMTVERIRRTHPQIGIVIFSSVLDLAPELLEAGVLAYIVKEDLSDQLLAAIDGAVRRQRTLSPAVSAYLEQANVPKHGVRLTAKEVITLKLLSQGLSTIEVAEQLGIDPRSAQNYITVMRRKTGSTTRTKLIDWYRRWYDQSDS